MLWFLLFNLGLIVLLTPVGVPDRVRSTDWPFVVAASAFAGTFLWRGRIGRPEGGVLVAFGVLYGAVVLRGG